MKLSSKCRYAVRAVFDIAFHQRGEPAQVKDIAERQQIPPRFLEQIFQDLKRAGLIGSKRGPRGGYRLRRPPGEICIGDILRAVHGPVVLCPHEDVDPGDQSSRLVTTAVFQNLSEQIQACFDQVTIEQLCDQGVAQGLQRQPPSRYVYSI